MHKIYHLYDVLSYFILSNAKSSYTLKVNMTNEHVFGGGSIRGARKGAGFTQDQLSEATGIDQASISRMENGKQGITLEYLKRIAGALGVPLGDLVNGAGWH